MLTQHFEVIEAPPRSVRAFYRWVAESCDSGSKVLDIGAGANHSGTLGSVVQPSPYLVGVDPDPSIQGNTLLDERHQTTLEDFAVGHPAEFDVAFAVYVLKHVADPKRFMRACANVLKPGGALFALTCNKRHYFGGTTWGLSRLGVSDWLLERLKGHDEAHEHHFPPGYRLNTIKTISRHLDTAGFTSVSYRCYDETRRYQWYLPTPLHWFPAIYTEVAYRVGSPNMMGHLSFAAVK